MGTARRAERVESNEDMLVAVAAGNRDAFRRLYDATSSAIFPICLRMLRNRDSAKEACQDAFFRIWQKAHLYDPEKGSALAWMVTVTRRCVLDRLATTRSDVVSLDEIDESVIAGAPARLEAASVEGAGLKRCLEQLDEKHSRAVLMAYFYGLTHEELAAKLDVPLGTAKSWVTRGLARLQDCMGR
jgi:RNA polymerase sigma-70 factor, ECF subfamily